MKCFGDTNKVIHCKMILLDEQELFQEVQEATIGQTLLDVVFQHLNLLETSYFGLRYIDQSNQTHWLDPNKKVSKQLKGSSPFVLYFSVKFYAADPTKLVEEITRYQFFLQVKQDILQGRVPVSMEMASELGSLAVQSELGDYDPRRHSPGYISEFRFLPNQSVYMESQMEELHKKLIGQVPSKAEMNYLEKVKWLDMYGVDLHPVLGEDNTEYFLGLTPTGIIVLRNKNKAGNYFWPRITKVYFRGKFFMLRVKDKNNFENTYGFETPSKGACKHLWRCCVEHHAFFRLTQAAGNNPQALFRLGSKFRYSGRTETQVQQDAKVKGRSQIEFSRSPSRRYQRRGPEDSKKAEIIEHDTRNVVLLPAHATTMPHIYRTTSPSTTVPRGSSPRSVKSAPYQPYDHNGPSSQDKGTPGRESRTMTRVVSSTSIKSNGTSRDRETSPSRAPSVDSQSSTDSRSRRHRHRRRSRGRSSDGESEASSKGSSRCHRRHRHRHRHSSNDSTDSKHRRRHHRHRSSDKMVESSIQWAQIQDRQNASKGHTATVRNLSNGYVPSSRETTSSRSPRRRHRKNRSPSESKKKYLPEELRDHIEFDLKGTEGMSEWQLKEIPYTKIDSNRASKHGGSDAGTERSNHHSVSLDRNSQTGHQVRSNSEQPKEIKRDVSTPQRVAILPSRSEPQGNAKVYNRQGSFDNRSPYSSNAQPVDNPSYRSTSQNSQYLGGQRDSHVSQMEKSYPYGTESLESGYPPSYSNSSGNFNSHCQWIQNHENSEYDSQCPPSPLKPQPSPQSSVTSGISMGDSSVSTALNDSGDADNSDSMYRNDRHRRSNSAQLRQNSIEKQPWNGGHKYLEANINRPFDANDARSNAVSHIVIKEHGREPRYISYVNSDASPPPLPPRQSASSSVYLTNNQNQMQNSQNHMSERLRKNNNNQNYNKQIHKNHHMVSSNNQINMDYHRNNHQRRPDDKQKYSYTPADRTFPSENRAVKLVNGLPEEVRTEL